MAVSRGLRSGRRSFPRRLQEEDQSRVPEMPLANSAVRAAVRSLSLPTRSPKAPQGHVTSPRGTGIAAIPMAAAGIAFRRAAPSCSSATRPASLQGALSWTAFRGI